MAALTHNGSVIGASSTTANAVGYDNTDSGLQATNAQDAIDEIIDGLGSASEKDVATSGDASDTQVVMGNDSRLSDARTPVSHTHTKSEITDFPTSLPASDTTDTYSSTGTTPVSGKAVAEALGTLDVSSVGGSGKYLTTISETNGKISATAATADTTVTSGSSNLVTSGAVYTAIDNLPEPMVFKGSLGTGGTITALPTNGTATVGDTYKVITAGTYASKAAKVGDTFICLTKTSSANTWELIPSGDEPSGTVTSVAIANDTNGGLTVSSGSPITTSGTIKLKHTNQVTAGTAKGDDSKTLTFGGTFTVPSVTYDVNGHITAKGTTTMTMPANPNTDTKVRQTLSTANSNLPLLLSYADNASTTANVDNVSYRSNNIWANPSTGQLTLSREGTTDNNYATALNFRNKNTTTGNTSVGYIATYNGGANGSNMVINSGGNIFIGSGESPANHFAAGFAQSTGEVLYIDSDNQIHLQANAQTIANRVGAQIDTSGNIVPEKADVATNNIGGIGTSTYKWANGYFTNINGVAVGTPKFTDASVYQSSTTTGNWRKILLGGQNDASSGTAVTNQTTQSYVSPSLEFQPSTGTLRATKFVGDISGGTGLTKTQVTTALGYTPPTENTDTKVTSAANHYSPAAATASELKANATGATAAWSIDVVKGVQIQRDAKGHVTGVTVTSGKIPANPNTDTKVTSEANHYTPAAATASELKASASGATAAWSIDVVKGVQVQRDSKGHVTGLTVTSGKIPANPNTDTKVTSEANHYSPAAATASELKASASGATAAWSIDVVKGVQVQRDSKGHVTGLTVTSGKIPANPNTDTKVKVNNTAPASGTWYYPTWYTATSGTGEVNANDGFRYHTSNGTTAAVGTSYIQIGNATAKGTAGNKQGYLRIFGNTAYYGQIQFADAKPTANRTYTLPNKGGTFALDSDISTLQTNFQAGVDSVYDAIVARGTTPASKSLSDVVTAIGKMYTPSGTKNITANGTVDIKSYASVSVSVPNSNSGTYTKITSNGTYDMAAANSYRYLNVAVPNSNSGTSSTTYTTNGTKDLGASHSFRYVKINVVNTNSGTYNLTSITKVLDMEEANSYRYCNPSLISASIKTGGALSAYQTYEYTLQDNGFYIINIAPDLRVGTTPTCSATLSNNFGTTVFSYTDLTGLKVYGIKVSGGSCKCYITCSYSCVMAISRVGP